MALLTDEKFFTGNNVKTLVQKLSEKNQEQALLIYNDINANKVLIEAEENRAILAEANLQTNLDSETNRAISSENKIRSDLNSDIAAVNSSIIEAKAELQGNITKEISDRKQSVDQLELKHDTQISQLDKEQKEYTDNQIQSATLALQTEFKNADQQLDEKLNKEISDREALDSEFRETTNAINNRITQDITAIQSDISSLETKTTTLENVVQDHTQKFIDYDSTIETITNSINTVESDIESLTINKLNVQGNNQILTGDLTIAKDTATAATGNLVVEGNLVVSGTTITTDRETALVEDNFILINSQDNTLVSPAGIAIKTGAENAYAIAYNPASQSVCLGEGSIDDQNDFNFNIAEAKSILTRDTEQNLSAQYSEPQVGTMLFWDPVAKMAVNGGPALTIDDVKKISGSAEGYLELEDKVLANTDSINSLNSNKQDIEDNSLETTAKRVPDAINEVRQEINQHKNNKDNPHKVTWAQVNTDALNSTNPLMNGEANPGILTTVSRSDHVHPVDISRAPVNHASASTQYGKATNTEYGHVIVDDVVSSTSDNPIQNKIIKDYVDKSIADLDVDVISISESESISAVSQVDGKIQLETQPIKIPTSQVIDLDSSIVNINNAIQQLDTRDANQNEAHQTALNQVKDDLSTETQRASASEQSIQSNLNTETTNRINADKALQTAIQLVDTRLTSKSDSNSSRISNLESIVNVATVDLNDSIQSIMNQLNESNYQKLYVLSFNMNIDPDTQEIMYKPILTVLDDGELS